MAQLRSKIYLYVYVFIHVLLRSREELVDIAIIYSKAKARNTKNKSNVDKAFIVSTYLFTRMRKNNVEKNFNIKFISRLKDFPINSNGLGSGT